jgi:hypothetical protein
MGEFRQRVGMFLTFEMTACAVAFQPTATQSIENALGKYTAGRVAATQEQDVEHFVRHPSLRWSDLSFVLSLKTALPPASGGFSDPVPFLHGGQADIQMRGKYCLTGFMAQPQLPDLTGAVVFGRRQLQRIKLAHSISIHRPCLV